MSENKNNPCPDGGFEIGIRKDAEGRLMPFCTGTLEIEIAEQVASRLTSLAQSVRAEARANLLG